MITIKARSPSKILNIEGKHRRSTSKMVLLNN